MVEEGSAWWQFTEFKHEIQDNIGFANNTHKSELPAFVGILVV
jgi:hypothetical protein